MRYELLCFMLIFSCLYHMCFTPLHGGMKLDDRKQALFNWA